MGELVFLRGARQLITLRGPHCARRGAGMSDLAVIRDGGLLIRDGVIVEANSARRLGNLRMARAAREIDAGGRVVLPGLVDSHTHLLYPPAAARGGVLPGLNGVSLRRLLWEAGRHASAMLRHGTTSIEITTGYAQDVSGEIKLLRAARELAVTGIEAVASTMPPESRGSLDDTAGYSAWLRETLLPRVAGRKLARSAALPANFPEDEVLSHIAAAQSLRLKTVMHLSGPLTPTLVGSAAAAAHSSLVHLEHLSGSDAALLARGEPIAVLLPLYGKLFAGSQAPARILIDSGAAVALGSGFNPGLCGAFNMQAVIAAACTELSMKIEEAITAATINAAYSLGRGQTIGSLEPGKQADVVALDLRDYRDLPRWMGVNCVHFVMKRGAIAGRRG